jgi:hypothetical protein
MSDIYSGAILVISAAGSSSVSQGCFLPRRQRCEIPYSRSNGEQGSIFVRTRLESCHEEIFRVAPYYSGTTICPITTRGWIFQEIFLARRILYCTKEELIWDCRDEVTCECGGSERSSCGGTSMKYSLLVDEEQHGSMKHSDPNRLDDYIRQWADWSPKLVIGFDTQ